MTTKNGASPRIAWPGVLVMGALSVVIVGVLNALQASQWVTVLVLFAFFVVCSRLCVGRSTQP